MAGTYCRANVVPYGSNPCKRVTSSVTTAGIHTLFLAVDYSFIIRDAIAMILGRIIKLEASFDSRTLFNAVAKDVNTAKRHLSNEVPALEKSYMRVENEQNRRITGYTDCC